MLISSLTAQSLPPLKDFFFQPKAMSLTNTALSTVLGASMVILRMINILQLFSDNDISLPSYPHWMVVC